MNSAILKYIDKLESAAKAYDFAGNSELRIHKKDDRTWFSEAIKDENGIWHEKYLGAKDSAKIEHLLVKKYCRELLKEISRIRSGKESSAEKLLNITEEYSTKFRAYVPADLISLKEKARRWAAAEYSRNPAEHADAARYQSLKGDMVRSRAELWIADYLFQNDIPYRYEAAFHLRDGRLIYPDFTIANAFTGEKIYLEYFGLMDSPEYMSKNLKRINDLAENGVLLGKNLLAAFESRDVPFHPAAVKRMLTAALQQECER